MFLSISRTKAIGIFLVFASSLLFLHYAPFSPSFIFRDAAFIYSFALLSVVWAMPVFVWAAGKITGSDSDVWVTAIPTIAFVLTATSIDGVLAKFNHDLTF